MDIQGKLSSEERAYLFEWCLLMGGAATGLALAWVLVGFRWSIPGELERARELGIVSLTTIYGYPKSRDLVAYGLTLGLPAIGAVLLWLLGRGSSDLGRNTLACGFNPPTRGVWLVVALSLLASIFFGWHMTAMLSPRWDTGVGSWIFLGEEGATLAWVQSIIGGGIYGRDFFSLYGPMFIYPLVWLMNLFGHTVLVERAYKLALDVLATGMLGFVLARTLRSNWLALGFVLLVCMLYPVLYFPSANTTILRTVLGIVPVACIALWANTRQKTPFIAGGFLLGQSLLFSHEAGFCSALAIAAMFLFDQRDGQRALFAKLRVSAIFFSIVLVSMAPMLGFLLLNGAGTGLVDIVYRYPNMVMLGFGGLPFPSLRDWMSGDFKECWFHFAVITVYSATMVALCVAWLRGVRSARFLFAMGLLVYGILLFRMAIGRSHDMQTMKVMLPAIILTALWMDELWAYWRRNRAMDIRSAFMLAAFTALLVNFVNGICLNPFVRSNIAAAWEYAFTIDGKFSASNVNAETAADLPRAGIFADKPAVDSLRQINRFVSENTRPLEYVYFFPNEAIYYFLFNRSNPTRYPIAYFATPYDRQREVIRDLEKNRPRYVLHSRETWRVDAIQEVIQIPFIVDYLKGRYRMVKRLDSVDVLERIPKQGS
jgi:hypothetical protein